MGVEESSRIAHSGYTEKTVNKSLFDFLYVIGRGGFGKVWKVRYKKTRQLFALKEMSKVKIIDRQSEKSIKSAREFLAILRHPYLYINIIAL